MCGEHIVNNAVIYVLCLGLCTFLRPCHVPGTNVCGLSHCRLAQQQYIVISINNSFVCSSCRCDERCDNPSAPWEYVGRSHWATIRLLCTKT